MICITRSFFQNEDGAVTVDWVVLTAAVIGISLAAMMSVFNGTQDIGDDVEVYLTDTTVEELAGLE